MESNRLIAGFLGWETNMHDKNIYVPSKLAWDEDAGENVLMRPDQLEFATSWDWLMPVVEKIEQTNKHK